MSLSKVKQLLFIILIISTFLGGVRTDTDTDIGMIRYVRIMVLFLLALGSISIMAWEGFVVLRGPVRIYLLFLIYALITVFWAPKPAFALWKIFELLVIMVLVIVHHDTMNQGADRLYRLFMQTTGVFVLGVLVTGLLFAHKGFDPLRGSIMPFKLHGSIYSMNSNDLGFWSGLLFCTTLHKTGFTKKDMLWAGIWFLILFLSQSRTFLLISFIAIMVKLVLSKRKGSKWLVGLFIVLIIGVLGEFVLLMFTRGDTNQVLTLHGRLNFWQIGLNAFVQQPLIGHGFYTGHRFLYLIYPDVNFSSNTFDSTWVDILVDTGIIGAGIMIVFLIRTFMLNRKSTHPIRPEITWGILFLVVRSLTGPSFQSFSLFLIYLLVLAVTLSEIRLTKTDPQALI